uniref:Probable serine/threonine-protein kinase PBL19 n=1 Tax=Tanacetum cinerariifolium TaxID=118510 RepID=A0A6L2K2C8_TANCI|nr:probable serine/threonine-protein kinase PBL19 [Tanacetum cinerariifolium]
MNSRIGIGMVVAGAIEDSGITVTDDGYPALKGALSPSFELPILILNEEEFNNGILLSMFVLSRHDIRTPWPTEYTRPPIPQNIWNERFDSDTSTPNVRSSSPRVFTFWELKKATKNFKVSPEIADNGFGRPKTLLLVWHTYTRGCIARSSLETSNPLIFFDSQMNAKLTDFGLAREETNAYLAPEYIYTRRLSSEIDVWSYGIFLEELITGKTSNLIADPRLEGKYSEKSIEKVAEIAKKCLANDPKLRPNTSEVLKVVKEALELEILNHQLPDAGKA